MATYKEYIEKLKAHRLDGDLDAMYLKIKKKIRRPFFFSPRFELAAAAAIALVVVSLFAYSNFFAPPAASGVMAYVFESEGVNTSPVMAYVFSK